MRVAMIGQKGVPARHGGVERHVEELGARLAVLGHEVTVFTRPNYVDANLREHRGMKLRSVRTIGTKHLDAIVHSALCTLVACTGGYDIVHYHAVGPCLVSPLARLRGRTVIATIHGQDWKRGKWGVAASAILRLGEQFALKVPNATIVVSESLAEHYRSGGNDVVYIPNGVATHASDDPSALEEFGLETDKYVLFAGRLVPEKGAHTLLDAWEMTTRPDDMKLAVAGDTSNSDSYTSSLQAGAGRDVVFTGYQYDGRLAALFRRAALFVLPSQLEGLPLVLLEALAYGAPVLASDIPPNVEVLGSRGSYFRSGDARDLADALSRALNQRVLLKSEAAGQKEYALATFDWDRVAEETSATYERAISRAST